jgi:hypothetical protein
MDQSSNIFIDNNDLETIATARTARRADDDLLSVDKHTSVTAKMRRKKKDPK